MVVFPTPPFWLAQAIVWPIRPPVRGCSQASILPSGAPFSSRTAPVHPGCQIVANAAALGINWPVAVLFGGRPRLVKGDPVVRHGGTLPLGLRGGRPTRVFHVKQAAHAAAGRRSPDGCVFHVKHDQRSLSAAVPHSHAEAKTVGERLSRMCAPVPGEPFGHRAARTAIAGFRRASVYSPLTWPQLGRGGRSAAVRAAGTRRRGSTPI